jgi:hypothetical protein
MTDPQTPAAAAVDPAPATPVAEATPAPAAEAKPAPEQAAAKAVPPPAASSPDLLTQFFKVSAAARIAASSLKKSAEVGVHFTDAPGDWRFTVEDGTPRLLHDKARDPDFDLTFGPAAVTALAAQPDADVGDLGILFFQHMLHADPNAKIKVKLHNGLIKLTMRGYLGVLASGGSKVFGWLANKGLKGPGGVATALSRLKKN